MSSAPAPVLLVRVGGGLEVDPVRAVAVGGPVGGGDVVGDALPAGVVVRRVDGAGHRRRGPAVRGAGRGRGGGVHAARHRHGGQHRGRQPDAAQAAGVRPGAPAPGQPRADELISFARTPLLIPPGSAT